MLRELDNAWRLLHLLAAAYWMGGLIVLAMLAVVAHRVLDQAEFRILMSSAGRAFLTGSLAAWAVIAISGVAMAAGRLHGIDGLQSTAWGRTLEAKTGFALFAVLLTTAHSLAGKKTWSPGSVAASRFLSPLILLATLGIFYLAVRLTEG